MNKKDAIRAMLDGKKVCVGGMGSVNYLYWDGNVFRFDSGGELASFEHCSNEGWEIYEEPPSLIDSALELLNSARLSKDNLVHLKWIYSRMIEVHGENPRLDYMAKMGKILGIPNSEEPTEPKTVIIEKWLVSHRNGFKEVIEKEDIYFKEPDRSRKLLKLLDTYEVTI